MPYLEITLLAVSILAQIAAAVVAIRGLRSTGPFRTAWLCVSLALTLMVWRRVEPLLEILENGHCSSLNVFVGLGISLLMLAGIAGLQHLFARLQIQECELQHLANTDFLTSLSNRRHFFELARHEMVRAARYESEYSLMMLDIDFFKRVNDEHGHHTGDRVLQEIAHLCSEAVRSVDIVGRLGGEEFAVFLPETGVDASMEAAERLRQRIESSTLLSDEGAAVHLTVSIGVVTRKNHQVTLDQLLNLADHALYRAKQSGRNRVCRES